MTSVAPESFLNGLEFPARERKLESDITARSKCKCLARFWSYKTYIYLSYTACQGAWSSEWRALKFLNFWYCTEVLTAVWCLLLVRDEYEYFTANAAYFPRFQDLEFASAAASPCQVGRYLLSELTFRDSRKTANESAQDMKLIRRGGGAMKVHSQEQSTRTCTIEYEQVRVVQKRFSTGGVRVQQST